MKKILQSNWFHHFFLAKLCGLAVGAAIGIVTVGVMGYAIGYTHGESDLNNHGYDKSWNEGVQHGYNVGRASCVGENKQR